MEQTMYTKPTHRWLIFAGLLIQSICVAANWYEVLQGSFLILMAWLTYENYRTWRASKGTPHK